MIVPLSGQLITTPMHPNIAVKSVFVKVMTNGKELGLRVEWSDQTKNDTTIGPQDFRDQVAIMFPVNTSGAPPFQCMGQSGGTTNIWRWNAEWQKDLGKAPAVGWTINTRYFLGYILKSPLACDHRTGSAAARTLQPRIWSGNYSDPTPRQSVEDPDATGF